MKEGRILFNIQESEIPDLFMFSCLLMRDLHIFFFVFCSVLFCFVCFVRCVSFCVFCFLLFVQSYCTSYDNNE